MSIKRFIAKEQFYHFFQPIYYLNDGEKLGYEVLLRSRAFPNPEIAFQIAKKENKLFELDSRSIFKAISTYQSSGKNEILFVNVFPSTISHPGFKAFLNQVDTSNFMSRQQVVFEISEAEPVEDLRSFKKKIAELKKLGYFIAIDDIGKGYSGVKSIIELEPDYLKIDRYFAKNLHTSKEKQMFISYLLQYCEQMECSLILEGIETEEELEMAKSLGVSIAQGYLLGKPALLSY
ncbi:EAL domain-containing protein [Siminovitchia sediminis]|uniref:EAL domain-containing protein n=1 Tax=Siminovitchia sediminis TaxID=1274353 RepID=A0ABW4KNX1_9BACI